MARPRKYDPESVSQKIMDTFWAKGYDTTAIADLIAATGLQKGSLYNAFGDKSKMFQIALLRCDREMVSKMVELMDQLGGREAITALLAAPAQSVIAGNQRGCLLCNSMGEYACLDDVAREIVNRSREHFEGAIRRAIARMSGPSTSIQANEVQALYFGMQVMARGGLDAEALNGIAQSALMRI